MQSEQSEPKWITWLEWLALAAIIALATYLRYWRIEEVPPGFNSDEAVGAMGALTTLRHGLQYSYAGQGGGGALGFYFAAAAFYLFGPSIATIRGLAAWASVVSLFANYWAIREIFRTGGLNRARWLAGLSTLGLAVSVWHLSTSRIAFAGIGVPFLMLPSVYFLWLGLNNPSRRWPFVMSGVFLGALMYIYLSALFVPPFYVAFFLAQWLIIKAWQSFPNNSKFRIPWPTRQGRQNLKFSQPYLTTRFWQLFTTGLVAAALLLPMAYVLLFRPELEPGTTRAGQAFFLNPQINQGDPWGLLGRSIIGNFGAFGVPPGWLLGLALPLAIPAEIGLFVFIGFLIALWRSLRGQADHLFILLWYVIMLFPSILAPDIIPHTLRAIGATTPVYVLAAITIVWLFELLWLAGRRWLPHLQQAPSGAWAWRGLGALLAAGMLYIFWTPTAASLYQYFYVFPKTNDAQAAYHVYAVDMAKEINRETRAEVAFILPRNTAAGDISPNYTVNFLTELAEAPAARVWVVDDETTVARDLTAAAARHSILRVVHWKTSKHTGADPKTVIPYYLQKFGHYERTDKFEYFDIDTYVLDVPAPNFTAETLEPLSVDFGGQLRLTGYALGDAGDPAQVNKPQAASNDLLWLHLAWQKTGEMAENLKVSAILYAEGGQLVGQMDKLLLSNILQVGSKKWEVGAEESTYFLIPIPPATPPGRYRLKLAVYGDKSMARLPVSPGMAVTTETGNLLTLGELTVEPARQPVDPDTLPLALPIEQELLPGLTLVGFETLPGPSVRPGEQVGASLVWLAGDTALPGDLGMMFTVKPSEGDDETPISEPAGLAGSGYPSSRWHPGELLRGWLMARIPPSFEPGIYKLRLRLVSLDNPDREIAVLPIGEFQVEGWQRVFTAPQPQVAIAADFGDQATLVGLDAGAQEVSPGDTVTVRLYWQPTTEFSQNYTAFVHLIGPDGRLYGQVDHIPGAGAFPTTGWLPGEYIADEYAIPLDNSAPPGDYHLEIGLYNPETGQRLTVTKPACQTDCQDDKVLLPGLKVQ